MRLRHTTIRNKKGFTLVELMIVVIIIGILTAVGVPLYMGYVKDAKVASAKAVIGTIVNAEKLYHQKSGAFIAVAAADFNTFTGNSGDGFLNIDVRDSTQFWTLDVAIVVADTSFTVTAAGKDAGDAGDYSDTTVILNYSRAADETWAIT